MASSTVSSRPGAGPTPWMAPPSDMLMTSACTSCTAHSMAAATASSEPEPDPLSTLPTASLQPGQNDWGLPEPATLLPTAMLAVPVPWPWLSYGVQTLLSHVWPAVGQWRGWVSAVKSHQATSWSVVVLGFT